MTSTPVLHSHPRSVTYTTAIVVCLRDILIFLPDMDRRTDDKSSERIRGLRIEEPDWTKEEETAVRWKLDLRIVPIVSVLYLLCFLDR